MMRKIEYIVIHCTGANPKQSTQAILDYWKNVKKWKSVGYYKIFSEDGSVDKLATLEQVTNGVKGFNSKSVHICYKGGVDEKGKPKDTRTEQQTKGLLDEIYVLLKLYPDAIVVGHRELGSFDTNKNGRIDTWERIKACPSFSVWEWLDSEDFRFMGNVRK